MAEILEKESELFGPQVGGREDAKKKIVLIVTSELGTPLKEAVDGLSNNTYVSPITSIVILSMLQVRFWIYILLKETSSIAHC